MIKSIFDELFPKLDFELKFPLKPGNYKLVDFKWPVVSFFRWRTRFKVDMVARVSLSKNSRRRSHLCDGNYTGKTF